MKRQVLLCILTLGLNGLLWSQGGGLYENFNYTAGTFVGGDYTLVPPTTYSNNWFTHSGAGNIPVVSGNLTYPGLALSSGNKITVPGNNIYPGGASKDINRALTISNTVLYFSALIKIVDSTQLSASTTDYFIHLATGSGTSPGTTFGARLGIGKVNSPATGFRLSIMNMTGGLVYYTQYPQDLAFGATYLVVVKYNRGVTPTVATLWVNPTTLGGPEPAGSVSNSIGTAAFGSFGSICIRNGTYTPKAEYDEIRVDTSFALVTPQGPPDLTLALTKTDITCYGRTDGTTTATFSGGTAPYYARIDTNAYSSAVSPKTFTGLGSGSHTVYIRDANNLVKNASVLINQPDALDLVLTPINATCFGGNTSISAAVTGTPMSDLQIRLNSGSWDAVTSTPVVFNGLPVGTHVVSLRRISDNTCQVIKATVVTQPDQLSLSVTPTNLSCYGSSTGSISAAVTGTPMSDLQININGSAFNTVTASPVVFNNLAAGNYTIVLRRISDITCLVARTTSVTQPDQLTLTLTPTNVICYGQSNGSISAVITGTPMSDLQININGGPFNTVTASPVVFNNLAAGNYTIVLRRISDITCSVIKSVSVTQPDQLGLTLTATGATCYGSSNGSVSAAVTGTPMSDLQININGGAFSVVSASPVIFSGLSMGVQTVVLRRISDYTCLATRTAMVTQPDQLALSLTPTDATCISLSNGSISAVITGTPMSDLQIKLDAGAFVAATASPVAFNSLTAGTHTVILRRVSDNSCSVTRTTTVGYQAVSKTLNLSDVFPEGLYAGSGTLNKAMEITDDLNIVPKYQSDTADMVTVELHNVNNYAIIEYSTPAALKTSGTVLAWIPCDRNKWYNATIRHCNFIEIVSALSLNFSDTSYINYAFNSPEKAYGHNMAMMIDGTAVIYSGDENQDGIIDGGDLSDIENLATLAALGYRPQDLNGDGLVDATDLSIAGNNATLAIGVITPEIPTDGLPCPGLASITDPRDGKVYPTVWIGTQCWMAKNLNTGTRISGYDNQANNGIIEKYCHDNLESNCDVYGGLYQWAEMVKYFNGASDTTLMNPVPQGNVQGICPPGWHLPGDPEWTTLTTYLGGEAVAGGKIKEAGTTHWASPNTGTNSSGFTALPGGGRGSNNSFYEFLFLGYFWSTTEYDTEHAFDRRLYHQTDIVYKEYYGKESGLSVRCLKDDLLPSTPNEGIHVPSPDQIIWNWNAVPGATGYKWNTTNSYGTAIDMDTVTTRTETGLTCNTAYTRYAWAYNTVGNSAALTMHQATDSCFVCGQLLTDTRDGKTYNTVQIGTQCWTAQNLNYGTRVAGSSNQANNSIPEKYCYDDLESNCDIYGGLYQGGEMVQYLNGASNNTNWNPVPTGNIQGICPSGWHLPSNPVDWTTIVNYLGGSTVAGGKMKETGYVHWMSPNTGATNSSGFTGLGASNRNTNGTFSDLTFWGNFWSVTTSGTTLAQHWSLRYLDGIIDGSGAVQRTFGHSVRCVKEILPPPTPTAGIHVPSQNQIVWNWNAVSNATGYKWSTTNDYGTATDMGTATTKTETGLTCNTAYTRYVWAYNTFGNSAALTMNQATDPCFNCGQQITDTRDGKTYNTVQIGTQCWMAQNLNFGTRMNGSLNQTDNSIPEKYCYDDLESNCDIYGGLYQWGEIVQYLNGASNNTNWNPVPTGNIQGICPSGWHIPSNPGDWTTIVNYLGGYTVAGGKMKETGYVHWMSPNTGATNSSGFTGLGASNRNTNGTFSSLTLWANFWSVTTSGSTLANTWGLRYNDGIIDGTGAGLRTFGHSVRCVKD